MMEYLALIIVLIVLVAIYYRKKPDTYVVTGKEPVSPFVSPSATSTSSILNPTTAMVDSFSDGTGGGMKYGEYLIANEVGDDIKKSNQRYSADIAKYSSGSSFMPVFDGLDGIQTNYLGFTRPQITRRRTDLPTAISEDENSFWESQPVRFSSTTIDPGET